MMDARPDRANPANTDPEPSPDSARDYPRDHLVHELFEQQVMKTPDAVAVVHGDRRLTYRELNALANRTAHHLRSLGIGPELLVGACFEGSVEAVVALFGIAKSGGAYLPLDAALPRQRLEFMLADAEPKLVLTCGRLASALPETSASVVLLDQFLAPDSDDPGNPAPRRPGHSARSSPPRRFRRACADDRAGYHGFPRPGRHLTRTVGAQKAKNKKGEGKECRTKPAPSSRKRSPPFSRRSATTRATLPFPPSTARAAKN